MDVIPTMVCEGTQTENYEFALCGALDQIIEQRVEQRRKMMHIFGKLVNAILRSSPVLKHTINGLAKVVMQTRFDE